MRLKYAGFVVLLLQIAEIGTRREVDQSIKDLMRLMLVDFLRQLLTSDSDEKQEDIGLAIYPLARSAKCAVRCASNR